ncbi:organic solute transporter Ostalpha-domain-containing protein [Leucosporidium creatinivorum]|uniref:Organic solute transporter Ostalpha-domain-containing protein n=1 Tax=Leucosporidium creatinivorum TaxID=106004 RepID=A0A1Y2DUD8_9BASI|nr:organic solute transporter Ostalpha-domain-containing protein [Leucosporidium creatinivorum]
MSRHLLSRSIISALTNGTCPESNTEAISTEGFWTGDWSSWSVVGWRLAAIFTILTALVAGWNIWRHCTNYRKPLEQRQIVRLLLTPVIFALGSFLSYLYFRHQEYFQLIRDAYEGLAIAAFLVLILLYLSTSPVEQREVIATKEKRKLVFPFCCWRFRPSKPKFLVNVKWSVLQYALLKPLISLAAVACEALGVYCGTSWSFRFASVYLFIIDFISLSVALYGLFVLYVLIAPELKGHQPLAKFTTIKIIVALVFYQGFVFSTLQTYGYIHDTTYWSADNISDGLNSLLTTFEMVLIAIFQLWAYPVSEYRLEIQDDSVRRTPFWRSFFHSQNYSDFAIDIWLSLRFYFDAMRGKEYTKARRDYEDSTRLLGGNNLDLESAFRGGLPAITLPSYDPEDPTGKVPGPIDPQRPYILRERDDDEESQTEDGFESYPPTRRVPYSDRTPSFETRDSEDVDGKDYLTRGGKL